MRACNAGCVARTSGMARTGADQPITQNKSVGILIDVAGIATIIGIGYAGYKIVGGGSIGVVAAVAAPAAVGFIIIEAMIAYGWTI